MPQAPKTFRPPWMGKSQHSARKAYEKRRMADPALHASKKFRSSSRWQTYRAWLRGRYPYCIDPFQKHGPGEPATEVHHVIGTSERLDLGCIVPNTAPVCHWCHARLEGLHRAGKSTFDLFAAWRAQARAEGYADE